MGKIQSKVELRLVVLEREVTLLSRQLRDHNHRVPAVGQNTGPAGTRLADLRLPRAGKREMPREDMFYALLSFAGGPIGLKFLHEDGEGTFAILHYGTLPHRVDTPLTLKDLYAAVSWWIVGGRPSIPINEAHERLEEFKAEVDHHVANGRDIAAEYHKRRDEEEAKASEEKGS